MKPLMLRLRAFGPYVEAQSIDFAKLDGRGLLLIHGPTGSGKTTLFDAICAALYGRTSVGRELSDMRSQQAADNVETRLEFVFQTGGQCYRVVRKPTQKIVGARGDLVERQHSAELYRLTGNSETCLATQPRNVENKVQEILRLQADQFCRVVMLPQGRFEEILRARPAVREADLKVLFNTRRYEAVEERLHERAKQAAEAIRDDQQERDTLLNSVGCETLDDLETNRAAVATDLRSAEAERTSLADREKQAQEALKTAENIQRKLDETAAAERAVKDLEREKPDREKQRARLEQAARAEQLSDAVTNRDERRREADEAAQQLESAKARLGSAQTELKQACSDLDKEERRTPEREAARAEVLRLRSLQPQVARLIKATETFAAAQEEARKAGEALDRAQQSVAEAQKGLKQEEKRRERAEMEAAKLSGLEAGVKNTEKTLTLLRRLQEARRRHAAAAREAKAAANDLGRAEIADKKARQDLDKAREDRMRGIAAELAAGLVEGEPCPVCGSEEHPAPARPARGVTTPEKITALETKAAEAEKALRAAQRDESRAHSNLAAAAQEVATLEKSLEKAAAGTSVSRLESDLKKQQVALETARKAKANLGKVRDTLRALNTRFKEARSGLEAAVKAEVAAAKEAVRARARVEELQKVVEKSLRAPGAHEKAVARQEKTLKQLDAALQAARDRVARAEKDCAAGEQKVKSAKTEFDRRETAAQRAQTELVQRLKSAGFADEKDYTSAVMKAHDRETLAAELRRYDEAVVAARDRLKKANETARGLKPPDLVSLRKACDEARRAIQECDTRIGSLRMREKLLCDVGRKLEDIGKRLAQREREHQRLQRLADLASGRAPANPGFHRFVLGYRLDEVLMHANLRLVTMSGDRYRLRRITEADGVRAMQAGLNLEVLDAYTGKVRPVETLSGGETFLAALALALGLSDAVQSRAGGVRLDTVFIDEGFGSLDPEALDRALEALLVLREGGRLVGIISHVAELRERIRDTRLEVATINGVSRAQLVLS